MGIKTIARRLGLARNTVRAALAADAPPKYERAAGGSVVDQFDPRIRSLLAEFPDMPSTVIAERLGWEHSSSVLRARVAQLRPLYRPADPADRTTYEAGQIVQCDLWFPGKVVPVGDKVLADRFGGRVMFPLVSVATIVPVLFIGLAGQRSLVALLVGGFFLGIGGTAFAVGVPFVNAWFPPERRGLAIGVFGVGMGGTAISALTTVKLGTAHGSAAPFLITAVALALYAVVAWLVLRDAPGRSVPTEPLVARLVATARLPITWQACILYAVAFGGYVAFSVYLPAYLRTAYGLEQADAANRMAGFVIVAVVFRPIGGWLSDRLSPIPVLTAVYAVLTAGATVLSFTPPLMPLGTIAFLTMAAALGAGSGGVFALVAQTAPANKIGSVTGLVGAAGGLGGFVPPLVMGFIHGRLGSYGLGLALLALTAASTMVLTMTVVRSAAIGRLAESNRPPELAVPPAPGTA